MSGQKGNAKISWKWEFGNEKLDMMFRANCRKNQIKKVNTANINSINKQIGKELEIKNEPKTLFR